MADIRPFRGLRHSGISPDQIGDVTSPPYDVFSPELQRVYCERHPHNVVRLILGEILAGEGDDTGRINRAVDYITDWRREGILATDGKPALYPYRQIFSLPDGTRLERRAFFTSVRLEKYGEGKIFPHEQTFPKTKGFLFDLYNGCGVHFGPIFSFYDDPGDGAAKALAASMEGAPIADFEEEGVRHTLWRCEDPSAIAAAQKALATLDVFIADGHHRYETSLNIQEAAQKAARKNGAPKNDEVDYTLMCLANASDPGMVVLPAHRLLKKIGSPVETALASLAEAYEVNEEPAPAEGEGEVVARRLRELGSEGRTAFCLFSGDGPLRYLVKKESAPPDAGNCAAEAVASLDVSRLHADVVDSAFAFSNDEADIAFTPDPEAALAAARSGECAVSLLLNPTPIQSVVKIAKAGGKMPHKSTYFFPKLRTGLVFHAFAPPAMD